MSQHYPRPFLRPRDGVAGMGALMSVKRVGGHPWLPINTLPAQGLADLADLGDTQAGVTAHGEFINALKTHIFAKAGTSILATANATSGLGNLINLAGIIYDQGASGTLQPDAQASWNAWTAIASPINSDSNLGWMFGRMISMNRGVLAQAAAAAEASGLFNDLGSTVGYTLMDTTQSGTTWYGGSTTTSKLTNQQWSTLFVNGWTVIQRAVINGVLPFTYLNLLVKGFVSNAPTLRRFPVWSAPKGYKENDPGAIAFRAMIKQIGWSAITQQWFSYTQQAWVQTTAAFEAQDAAFSGVITGLSYISGAKILDQIRSKAGEYLAQRDYAIKMFASFDALANGPLGSSVPFENKIGMDKIKREFNATDVKAFETMNALGMWPTGVSAGGVSGLGAATLIVSGVIAVTTLGIIGYIVATLTATSRKGADLAGRTTETVLASIDTLKAGCARTYAASDKRPSDEVAYAACIQKATDLVGKVPKPPSAPDDLFGFKGMAMAVGALALGGMVLMMMKGKKAPTSFKVVADD